MNIKKKIKRLISLLTIVLLTIPTTVGAVSVWYHDRVSYGSWGTKIFHAGEAGGYYENAYCVSPSKPAPISSTEFSVSSASSNVKWWLYFMYNAPGDWWMGGDSAFAGVSATDNQKYVYSHLIMTYVVNGENAAAESIASYKAGSYWPQAKAIYDYILANYKYNDGTYYYGPDEDGDGYREDFNDFFSAYVATPTNGSYQSITYWEYSVLERIESPSSGYLAIKKTTNDGTPVDGIKFAACTTYDECNKDASYYTSSNCNSLSTHDGGACLQVDTTGSYSGYSGYAYFGYEMSAGEGFTHAFPYMPGDSESGAWIYLREVGDEMNRGDNKKYNPNWSDGSHKIFKYRVFETGENVVTQEWAVKKNSSGEYWKYPYGVLDPDGNYQSESNYYSTSGVIDDEEYASFRVKKTFKAGSETTGLDGWQFEVYNSSNALVATLTTGSDGYTQIYGKDSSGNNTLSAGTSYTIKEKVDANGFAINVNDSSRNGKWKPTRSSDVVSITINDLGTTKDVPSSPATENERYKYCFRVEKDDSETNDKLSNFKFYIDGNTSKNCTTGSDGTCYIKDLDYGNYTVKEESGKTNYWVSGSQSKSISANQLTRQGSDGTCTINTPQAIYKNYKKYCCLKVKKVDTRNNLLPGSSFSTTINGNSVIRKDSDDGLNDGYVSFFTDNCDSNSLRTFTLTEVLAPDQFRRRQETVSVKEIILPQDKTRDQAIAECNKSDGKTSSGTNIVNSSGTVTAYNDKYLINWYKERENGTNTNNAEFKVYFKDGSTTYYVKAKMNGSNLATESWKDKTKNVTKTCNVFDTLTTNANEATTFKSTNTRTNNTDTLGEVCIIGFDTDLSAGTSNNRVYTVEETKSLDYHTFGNAKTKNIQVALDYYPEAENVLFKNYKTEFKFTKTVDLTQAGDNADEGSWKNLTTSELKKIPFKVYPSGSNTPLTLVKTADGVYEDSRNNIDKPSGENIDTLYLNNNREIIIYHLPVGNYIIKEERKCCDSTCPNGSCTQSIDQCIGYYHPNDAGVPFEITRCSSPNATSCGSGNYGTVLKTMGNTPTEIEFTKKDFYNEITPNTEVAFADEEERSAFDDIVFNLKDKSNNSVSLVYVGKHITDASNPCMNDNDYSIYRYVRDGETLPSGTTRVTDLHTCGGHIHITNLCRGKDYKMVEVSVPEYSVFQGTSATAQFNIPFSKPNSEGLGGANCCTGGSSRQTNTKATISDLPTKITIWKKNYNPNENIKEDESKKETANFQVYRCPYSVTKCTRAAATYGPIKFEELGKLGNTNEYTYQFKTKQKESGGITTLTLDSNVNEGARLILTYLPANYKYVVVETNAPDGYYNVEGELADVEVIASTVEHDNRSYDKYNYGTRIKFTKKDFYQYYNASDVDKLGSSKKIFDSMTFKLHDKDGNVVNLTEVSAGHYRFIDKNGKHNGTVTDLHTNNGEMLITHLYRNENYYIEETASDTEGDFILPNNVDNSGLGLPSSMNGNKHPILKYEMGNLVPNSSDPNEVPDSLTQEIYNDGTRVVFEKRDADTGELIDDNKNTVSVEDHSHDDTITTFNVYRCPKTQSTCTVDNGELVYFEDRTYIKDKNGEDITKDITAVTPPVLAYKYSKENKSQGKVKDLHTDRGVLVIAYLPSKNYKYVLYETVAPNGYYQPRKAEAQTPFTVKESSLTTGETYEALTTIVQNEPTKIFFKKDDIYHYYVENDLATESDYNKKIFDSMTFQLRNAEGKVMKFKCSSNEEATGERNADRCETGEYRYIPIDDDNAISELHTLNGEMLITHLYRNETYYLEEIKADTEGNFILPDYFTYDYPLPFDHKGHPVVKYIVPENGPTSQESVTELISNVPSRVVFQKRDSKYNYLIPDELTTFNVYQCDEEVEVCKPENGRIINFEARAEIPGDQEDPGKEVYKYSKLNAGTERTTVDLHPYYGELILRYLPTNHKYVLVETVSPQRYMLPEGENAYTYFTISKTKVDVEEIQVPNKPVSLLLRKYSQDGELLEGAEFKISETVNKNCNMNKSPEKENLKEALLLKTIRDGVYEVRPAGDTNVFRTCQDRPDMPCNQINRTLTYPEFDTATFGNSMGDFEALVNSRQEKIDIVAGEAIVQYLKYGQCYVIEETKAPKGYSLPEKESDRFTRIQITDAEQVFDTYEELVNTPTPFTFFKLDEFNKPLDGAKYKLQVLDDNKIYKDVAVTKEEKENGEFYYRVDPESENYIMETKDGKATISYLEEGQYRVLEIEAPEGYELPKKTYNVATFFVDANGKVYGSNIIANKPATEKKMIKPTAKATFIINIVTGQKIIKYGVVIGVIVAIIGGLIIFQKKKISKKDE